MRLARTWGWGRTRRYDGPSNDLGPSLPYQSCQDCIIATRGYDFREGQVYGAVVARRFRAMGIRDKPIAPGSPWQNGFAERLIGSIRRECTDHVVALSERHLRRVLQSYARYYNESRTHRALNKDAPQHRAIESLGAIISRPGL